MYKIKVFDATISQWRDVFCINEEYGGYCCSWDPRGTEMPTLVDAFEVADLLWYHSDEQVRSGVFDAAGTLVYDSHAPIDLRSDPRFEVLSREQWIDLFCTASSQVRSAMSPAETVDEAQRLFSASRHEDPWAVVWALARNQPVPLTWPHRWKSAVQLGVEPGT